MNNSKPGNKLDPALKAIIDPVYEHDKARYGNICRWVWWCQRNGWTDEIIGMAVKSATHIHEVENWWAYLTRQLSKSSGRIAEDDAQRYKREEMNFLNNLLGPNWTKNRDRDKRRS